MSVLIDQKKIENILVRLVSSFFVVVDFLTMDTISQLTNKKR